MVELGRHFYHPPWGPHTSEFTIYYWAQIREFSPPNFLTSFNRGDEFADHLILRGPPIRRPYAKQFAPIRAVKSAIIHREAAHFVLDLLAGGALHQLFVFPDVDHVATHISQAALSMMRTEVGARTLGLAWTPNWYGCEMLKPVDQILNSDSRFTNMVGGLDETGAIRLISITDLYALVEPLRLDPAVPSDIQEQFDKARHAFIYSWFAYDLVSLAEQQGYQTLELALREKLPPAERKKADEERWGLAKLLKIAVAHRWLTRADFEALPQYPGGPKICVLDVISRFRNELAHGSRNLFPNGSIMMLELCVDILNRLFQGQKPA